MTTSLDAELLANHAETLTVRFVAASQRDVNIDVTARRRRRSMRTFATGGRWARRQSPAAQPAITQQCLDDFLATLPASVRRTPTA